MSTNNILTVFDDFFDDTLFPLGMRANSARRSNPINVSETDDKYIIESPIPGIEIKDLDIELNDKVLTISYSNTEDNKQKDSKGKLIRHEYSSYAFSRSVGLNKPVNKKSVKAEYKKGILKIEIEKAPEAKPEKIEVKIQD